MKRRYKVLIVLAIVVCSWLFDAVSCYMNYYDIPIEERIENSLVKEPFSVVEFDKGYICLYSDYITNDECLVFTYLKRDWFSDTGFSLRALIGDDYDYYINNSNFKKCYELMLNNFSRNTIYFSCCEPEYAKPVKVNGEEVKLYDVTIQYGDKTYLRKFWFYLGKDNELPSVEYVE